jgi:hypothetical protein
MDAAACAHRLGASRHGRGKLARKGKRGMHLLLPASIASLIVIISVPGGLVYKSAHAQTLDPRWGAPVDAQIASDRAEKAAKERLDRMEHCYRFPNSPAERCRIQWEDDRRPSEKHHERQVLERRW